VSDEKDTEQKRYRALAFVKGESLAKEKDSHVYEDEIPTWPYLVRKEFLAAIIVTIILLVWSIALNAPLEDPSDPSVTPNPAKAPWYFLGLQEMLVYFDPWIAGVFFPSLIVMGFDNSRSIYAWAWLVVVLAVAGMGFTQNSSRNKL